MHTRALPGMWLAVEILFSERIMLKYWHLTIFQLRCELASRQPELYMTVLHATWGTSREQLLLLLHLMDLDAAEGRKPPRTMGDDYV